MAGYLSTDPTAGTAVPRGTTPLTQPTAPVPGAGPSTSFTNTSPNAIPTAIQPGEPDPTAAAWRIGQPIPPGYETVHPGNDPSQLAIQQIGGYQAPTSTGAATGGAQPSVTNPQDPTQVHAWLSWMATQPGHDPILDTPGGLDYYQNAILSNGGLTDTNYWKNKATTAAYGGAVGAGGGGGSLNALGNWPFYNSVPTTQQAMNMPGVQFAVDMAGNQLQKSAAAQGSLLNSGTLQDLSQLAANTALGNYYLPLAQLQYQYNQGNFNNLASLMNAGQYASSINQSPV